MGYQRTSILDGVNVTVLQARLASLQQAYLDLTSGGKLETAAYAQGDGTRSVTYTRANLADLIQTILAVQKQIDILNGVCINRRPPMLPLF